jgi:hypothetical protein
LNDEHVDALTRLAFVYLSCNQHASAEDILTGLNSAVPGNEVVIRLLVYAYWRSRQLTRCLDQIKFYLKSWPDAKAAPTIGLIAEYVAAASGGDSLRLQHVLKQWHKRHNA